MKISFLFSLFFGLSISLYSQSKTTENSKGKLIFSDDFNRLEKDDSKEELGKNWTTNSKNRAQGLKQADLKNGTLHIKMTKTANHAVSVKHDAPFKNGTVQVKFQITDKKGIAFNFNDPAIKNTVWAGHVCQVKITPSSIKITDQKEGIFKLSIHSKKKAGASAREIQELTKGKSKSIKHNCQPNTWYNLTLNFEEETLSVWINDMKVGTHSSLGFAHNPKQNIAFSVASHAIVDDLKIYSKD
ncbi:family 16 glycoside hydrolase [Flavicella sediminum]|uniref:family 16 glycoside hydrolase n=1 Tax=Flavicella sediminum TaxID=2585141 RepID=UPI0011219AB9|nr:family 16 glycoside hydrolase [Flavicella sediminum]